MKKLLIILLLTFLGSGCLGEKQNNDLRFASEIWKTTDKRTRGRMVYDLQKSRILIGKTRREVIELLGQSDSGKVKGSDSKILDRFYIDTEIITDIFFTIHYTMEKQTVISTDIGD